MFDEQGLDPRSLQLGEGLPGALATGRRARLGGLGEFDEPLGGVALGEFAERDHGDLVLGVLRVLVGEFAGVGGLAGEQHPQRLGASGTAELGVGGQGGERLGGQRRDVELEERHQFQGGLQGVGAALEEFRQRGGQAGADFLGVARRQRVPVGGRLVDRIRVGPLGEQAQGLATDFLR